MFEKNTVDTHRQDIHLTRMVVNLMVNMQSSIGVNCFNDLELDIFSLKYCFLIPPLPHDHFTSCDKKFITVNTFANLLRRDIEHILNELDYFNENIPFVRRDYEHLVSRLAHRALLWSVFKYYSSSCIESDFLGKIKNNLIKPVIFQEILMCLS